VKKVVEIFIGIHNISSPQRLKDIAKIVFGSGDLVKALVVTKPTGLAAQAGLPEVMVQAYRLSRTVLVFPSLMDAMELLRPDTLYLIARSPQENYLELQGFINEIKNKNRILVMVHGEDANFSKEDLARGRPIFIEGFSLPIGPVAEVAILMYVIKSFIR